MKRNVLHAVSCALSCLIFTAFAGVGCDSGGGTGTLELVATDAPLPPDQVESAVVEVTQITVHRNSEGESGFLTIFDADDPDEDPIRLQLNELRNGVVARISETDLPVGTYRQIRLFFTDGYLELTNGNTYRTDDDTLELTSQATSGLKVFPDPPIEVFDGESSTVCLDFDLSKSFRPQPASDPLNASTYSLGPVVRAGNLLDTGEISGTVEGDDGTGTLVPVDGATVYILPAGETDVENAFATTITEADGTYAVICLPEDTYDVLAVMGDREDRVDGVQVDPGMIRTVDLTIATP